jgi:hypothetical protein
MFDTNSLYTLGLMANTYSNVLNSPEELEVIDKIRASIRAELKLRSDEINRLEKEIDLISKDYENEG